jgi:hypothetical protein
LSILTYLTRAEIRDAEDEIDGKVLTRPALLITDGENLIYAVDVDINQKVLDRDAPEQAQLEPLRNVPLARGNFDLLYADAGNAVRLRRSASGQYEVVGFSKEMPGKYKRVAVNLTDLTLGPIVDLSLTARPLTYGELATFGGYGTVPYGVVAIFRGGTLLELRIP